MLSTQESLWTRLAMAWPLYHKGVEALCMCQASLCTIGLGKGQLGVEEKEDALRKRRAVGVRC